MTTYFLSFLLVVFAVLAMAAGVLLGRKPIAGSCGGVKGEDSSCGCKDPCARRLECIQESSRGAE